MKTQIEKMTENPIAAQITLQFALNRYKDSKRQNKKSINPYLKDALVNLAKYRQDLHDGKEDFDIFGGEPSDKSSSPQSSKLDLSTDRELPSVLLGKRY